MSVKRLFLNIASSMVSKLINALVQIVCLPVLLKVYGKENYGLIVIAMSLNVFVMILQFGLPTGIQKFIPEWLARDENKQLNAAMRTIASFNIAVALMSGGVLFVIAQFWTGIFNVQVNQIDTLKNLLLITAVTSSFAIPAATLDQMLIGAQELGFVSGLDMVKNVLFALLVAFIYMQPNVLSIPQFYAIRCLLMFLLVPVKIWKWTRYGTLLDFFPGWNIQVIRPLFKYSLSIFVFSIFITMSKKLCPIILSIRSTTNAGSVMAEYQILNYIQMLLIMFASSFMAALIPHISGSAAEGDCNVFKKTIVQGTKVLWTFGALIGFGIIMLSHEVIMIYVGEEYLYLNKWLALFVIASLYNLYCPALSSAIVASGKLRPLVYATGFGCFLSLSACWLFAPIVGVGSVVYAYMIYIAFYFIVTHFWYFPRYFKVKPFNQIIKILLPPVFAGTVMCFAGRWFITWCGYSNDYVNIGIGTICGSAIYMFIVLVVYIRPREARALIAKLLHKGV